MARSPGRIPPVSVLVSLLLCLPALALMVTLLVPEVREPKCVPCQRVAPPPAVVPRPGLRPSPAPEQEAPHKLLPNPLPVEPTPAPGPRLAPTPGPPPPPAAEPTTRPSPAPEQEAPHKLPPSRQPVQPPPAPGPRLAPTPGPPPSPATEPTTRPHPRPTPAPSQSPEPRQHSEPVPAPLPVREQKQANSTAGESAQVLRVELLRLQRQLRQECSRREAFARAASSARASAVAAQEELKAPQAKLAQAENELREAWQREEVAQEELEALQYGDLHSPGRTLERLPNQKSVALLAGGLGLLGVLGPQAVFCCFLAVVGSGAAATLLVCSAGYLTSSLGIFELGRPSLWAPFQWLLYSSGFDKGRLLWALAVLLGVLRWCLGLEWALCAVVEEPDDDPFALEVEDEGSSDYLLDNSELKSDALYLAYRFTKRMEDKDEDHVAAYGSIVRGLDEGDGWLRVGRRYLPMEVRGVPVLILQPCEDPSNTKLDGGSSTGGTEATSDTYEGEPGKVERAMMDRGPTEFEEFARLAGELSGGTSPSRAQLLDVWEAAGGDLDLAVEKLLQRYALHEANPAG